MGIEKGGKAGIEGEATCLKSSFRFGIKKKGKPCARAYVHPPFSQTFGGFLLSTKELETSAIATRQHLRIMPISKSNSEINQVENEKGVEARLKLFYYGFSIEHNWEAKCFGLIFKLQSNSLTYYRFKTSPEEGKHTIDQKKILVIKQYCLVPIC